jgi:hypothetical protein
MDFNEETVKTVQGRIDIIQKSIVSEENLLNIIRLFCKK